MRELRAPGGETRGLVSGLRGCPKGLRGSPSALRVQFLGREVGPRVCPLTPRLRPRVPRGIFECKGKLASSPVNQWVVIVEEAESQHGRGSRFKGGDEEVEGNDFPTGESDWEGGLFGDDLAEGAIK